MWYDENQNGERRQINKKNTINKSTEFPNKEKREKNERERKGGKVEIRPLLLYDSPLKKENVIKIKREHSATTLL